MSATALPAVRRTAITRPACTQEDHEALKRSASAWLAGTQRLPHWADREVFTESPDGGWDHWRNCRLCKSTLMLPMKVRPLALIRGGDAPELCECQRALGACDCALLFGETR